MYTYWKQQNVYGNMFYQWRIKISEWWLTVVLKITEKYRCMEIWYII